MPVEKVEKLQRAQPKRNDQVYQASKLYEAQFLREMTKAMRKSVQDGGFLKKNMGEKIFQEKLDHEYVDKWVNKGGVGLADVVYNHLMERYHGVRPLKPRGPLPMKTSKNIQLETRPVPNESKTNFHMKSGGEGTEVTAPWDGKVSLLESEMGSLRIDHSNGLKSSFLIPGAQFTLAQGQEVKSGQQIALLDKADWEFLMQVDYGELEGQDSLEKKGSSF